MNKDKIYIEFIVNEIEKGNVRNKDVSSHFCDKFQVSNRTFDKFWKIANEAYLERRSLIESAKLKETIEQEKQVVKTDNIEREKAIEMHSNILKIIYNKVIKQKEPSIHDINAFNSTMEKYAKLRGFNAPEKLETTIQEIRVIREDAEIID